jgi:diguanylate cyclase (GGDEF)-like protein
MREAAERVHPPAPEKERDLPALALRAFDALPKAAFLLDESLALVRCNEAGRCLGLGAEPGMSLEALLAGLDVERTHDRRAMLAALGAVFAGNAAPVAVALSDDRIVELLSSKIGGGWVVVVREPRTDNAIARQARFDPLTGLPNRLHFRERLAGAAAHMRTTGTPAALLYLDLDRFKQVNDTLGHPVGDALLVKVAERMRAALRGDDVVGRLGGDEFAVLTQAVDAEALATLGKRLIDLVSRPYLVEGHMLSVGTSIGLALMPEDADDVDRIAKCADLALYRAKEDGRGVLRRYAPEMDQRIQARRSLEFDLRKALALREFELFYQPQFDVDSGRATGFEALIRWRHPERGLVPPSGFVPLAEETGLIVPIGEWVLRTACAEAATWPEDVAVAVNLSPAQFRTGKLVQTVLSTLAATGLSANRLELEITESVLLDNDETNRAVLTQLHELGVRIAVDDFGTGYSSLAYLRSFPFDKIKIDQSFVREMASDADSEAIVRAVVDLGATLGMTTIAEGVETREELERIRAHGCTEIQGFLFGRPTPLEEVRALIAKQRDGAAVAIES